MSGFMSAKEIEQLYDGYWVYIFYTSTSIIMNNMSSNCNGNAYGGIAMENDLSYYMGLNYRIEFCKDKETDSYVLAYPDLPGCVTYAANLDDGLIIIESAKKELFERHIQNGYNIPEPLAIKETRRPRVIGLPRKLFRKIAAKAMDEGLTVTQYCIKTLAMSVDAYDK